MQFFGLYSLATIIVLTCTINKTTNITVRLQNRFLPEPIKKAAQTMVWAVVRKLLDQFVCYGTPNRSWVSSSTLLYHGSQYVISNWLSGSAIISEKLVAMLFTL